MPWMAPFYALFIRHKAGPDCGALRVPSLEAKDFASVMARSDDRGCFATKVCRKRRKPRKPLELHRNLGRLTALPARSAGVAAIVVPGVEAARHDDGRAQDRPAVGDVAEHHDAQ